MKRSAREARALFAAAITFTLIFFITKRPEAGALFALAAAAVTYLATGRDREPSKQIPPESSNGATNDSKDSVHDQYRRFLALLNDDMEKADKLIQFERQQNPSLSRINAIKSAISRWEKEI